MQNTEKQREDSGKAQIALLVVLALAAGSAGVWSELKAATQTSPTTPSSKSSQIDVVGTNIFGSIGLNGDGTANVSLFQIISVQIPCQFLACFETISITSGSDPTNASYAQTVNLKPGASGQQIGSGVATATLAGIFNDFSAGTLTPVTMSFQMEVQGAGDVSSVNNHTLTVQPDPNSGKIVALRVTSVGTQASGSTAGSISMSVNGAPYYSETGVFGQVQAFSSHSVTRLQ